MKPYFDRCLAALLLIILLPVILVAALLVKLTSRGPALFTQVRVGRGGRHFTIYKLRTMHADGGPRTGFTWVRRGDMRITPIGAILRNTHVDELPQLVNVLRGEMSFVGPRPERPLIVERLRKEVEGYDERHRVKPGITGLAQIHLPPDVDVNCVRRKLFYDRRYLATSSFGKDLRIMACTGLSLVGLPMRVSRWLLRIDEPLPTGLSGFQPHILPRP